MDNLRQAIEKSGNKQQLDLFQQLIDELSSLDLLNDEVNSIKFTQIVEANRYFLFYFNIQQTIDEHLCRTFPTMIPKNQFRKMKNKVLKAYY